MKFKILTMKSEIGRISFESNSLLKENIKQKDKEAIINQKMRFSKQKTVS